MVPSGNYDSEGKILKELEELPDVTKAVGLANQEAMDGYMLTDALTPRQFSELANMDYEVASLLYSAYAVNDSQYGEFVNGLSNYKVPLYDMFMFVKDEMRKGRVSTSTMMTAAMARIRPISEARSAELSTPTAVSTYRS